MTYLRPHNNPGKRVRQVATTAVVFVVVFVGLVQWLSPAFFPGLFMSIAHPFWQTGFSIESGALRSPAQLLAENEGLKRTLADMQTQIASSSIAAILQENTELKAQFGRASTTPRIVAAVLSRPPLASYDELILDIGQDRGVSSTTLVYAANNVLIGRVRESFAHTSKAILFTSPGQTYPVLIGSTHIPATAVGQGGGQYRAEVAHGASVHVADPVTDSSLSDGVFGTVASVATDPSNPFDTVFITPPVNIYQIRWAYIASTTRK